MNNPRHIPIMKIYAFIIVLGILFSANSVVHATDGDTRSVVNDGNIFLKKGVTLLVDKNSAAEFNFTIPSDPDNMTIKDAKLSGGFSVEPILGVPQTIGFVVRRDDGTVSMATETSGLEGVLDLAPGYSYELVFVNRDILFERQVMITSTFEYSYITESEGPVTESKEERLCFIFTVLQGSPLESEVYFLRHFRDETLPKIVGEESVRGLNAFYYSFSPQVAKLIKENSWIQVYTIAIISPIIGTLRFLDEIISLIL